MREATEQMGRPDLLERLDAFGRRHPRLALAAVILMALAATIALICTTESSVILYEVF